MKVTDEQIVAISEKPFSSLCHYDTMVLFQAIRERDAAIKMIFDGPPAQMSSPLGLLAMVEQKKTTLGQFLPTHGRYQTPEYYSWAGMIQRCTNPKYHTWHRYGGRGIRVCEEWLKFEAFLRDMGPRPVGHSLDRVNNDGNYEPDNCRWVTHREQCINRSKRSGTSRFAGVSRWKATGKWRASIWSGKNVVYLGTFETEEAAAQAVSAAKSREG